MTLTHALKRHFTVTFARLIISFTYKLYLHTKVHNIVLQICTLFFLHHVGKRSITLVGILFLHANNNSRLSSPHFISKNPLSSSSLKYYLMFKKHLFKWLKKIFSARSTAFLCYLYKNIVTYIFFSFYSHVDKWRTGLDRFLVCLECRAWLTHFANRFHVLQVQYFFPLLLHIHKSQCCVNVEEEEEEKYGCIITVDLSGPQCLHNQKIKSSTPSFFIFFVSKFVNLYFEFSMLWLTCYQSFCERGRFNLDFSEPRFNFWKKIWN